MITPEFQPMFQIFVLVFGFPIGALALMSLVFSFGAWLNKKPEQAPAPTHVPHVCKYCGAPNE